MQIERVRFDSRLGRQAAALRVAVFVEEQGVPAELEIDHYDPDAVHLVGIEEERVVATLRLVAQENGRVVKIGRVAVARERRGRGLGGELMQASLAYARGKRFEACVLTAQIAVIGFYEKLGFVAHGPVFDECGIAHRRMRLELT